LNFLNRNKVKKLFGLEESGAESLSANEDIIENYEQKEKLEKIEKQLQKIPVKQREVFIMRNFDDLSYKEISEVTGRSEGGLKANYFHALNKIMELMKEDE
jgi:RNA polymerase sigma-70 factor (ECF subfamily)